MRDRFPSRSEKEIEALVYEAIREDVPDLVKGMEEIEADMVGHLDNIQAFHAPKETLEDLAKIYKNVLSKQANRPVADEIINEMKKASTKTRGKPRKKAVTTTRGQIKGLSELSNKDDLARAYKSAMKKYEVRQAAIGRVSLA